MAGLSEEYDVTVHVHRETYPDQRKQGALLVSQDDDKDNAVWVPKSEIVDVMKTRQPMVWVLTLPEWLIADKGLEVG